METHYTKDDMVLEKLYSELAYSHEVNFPVAAYCSVATKWQLNSRPLQEKYVWSFDPRFTYLCYRELKFRYVVIDLALKIILLLHWLRIPSTKITEARSFIPAP